MPKKPSPSPSSSPTTVASTTKGTGSAMRFMEVAKQARKQARAIATTGGTPTPIPLAFGHLIVSAELHGKSATYLLTIKSTFGESILVRKSNHSTMMDTAIAVVLSISEIAGGAPAAVNETPVV